MVAVKKLAMYLIPLIVLVFSTSGFFGEDGLFGGIKDMGESVRDAAPNVSAGMEKLQAEHQDPPGDISVQLNSFTAAMEAMLESNEVDCFGSHIPFSELGTDGWFEDPESVRVSLRYNPQTGNTTYTAAHTNGYIYDMDELEMSLCVVAGKRTSSGLPAYNFFRNFIAADSDFQGTRKYTEVIKIAFGFEDKSYNGNRIRVEGQGFAEDVNPVNDESDNYGSGGLLYKPKEDMVCFFPTKYESDYSDDGIQEAFLVREDYVDSELRSLSFRLRRDPFDDVKYCDQSRNVIPEYTVQEAWEFAGLIDEDIDYGDYREFIDHISPPSSCKECGGNVIIIFTDDDWKEISGAGLWDTEEEFDYITKCLLKKKSLPNPSRTSCSLTFMDRVNNWFDDTCIELLGEWICEKPDEPKKD